MSDVEFSGNRLTIDSKYTINFELPIDEAFETKNIVIVQLDVLAVYNHPEERKPIRNIIGFDLKGNQLWKAELPTELPAERQKNPLTAGSDFYWCIRQREPLIATSYSSYNCRIDEATGKIEIIQPAIELCPPNAFHVSRSRKRLTIDAKYTVNLPYPIKAAFIIRGLIVVVLLDSDAYPKEQKLRKNLLGFDRQGNKLWEAELPRYSRFDVWVPKGRSSLAPDSYEGVVQREPLIVWSWSGYDCRIDEATGKIESAEFQK